MKIKRFPLLLATTLALTAHSSGNTVTYGGQTYKTVKIGEQVWFAENLNYEAEGSKCYDNNHANCAKYGRLYNWETAMKVCPKGWHLPSDDEWKKLVDIAGGDKAGAKLKATSGWNNNGNGTDKYGFSALPGGNGDPWGGFRSVGDYGYWWSASEYNSDDAYSRLMFYYGEDAGWNYFSKFNLFSVRCIKD